MIIKHTPEEIEFMEDIIIKELEDKRDKLMLYKDMCHIQDITIGDTGLFDSNGKLFSIQPEYITLNVFAIMKSDMTVELKGNAIARAVKNRIDDEIETVLENSNVTMHPKDTNKIVKVVFETGMTILKGGEITFKMGLGLII